jgi:hypothetical protein
VDPGSLCDRHPAGRDPGDRAENRS